MTGVSVGWFDPHGLYPDPQGLVDAIQHMLAPRLRKTRAWPLAVSSIRANGKGVGVAYALVGGHVPIHMDTVGLDDSDGRIFQLVLAVENRPAILTAPETAGSTPVFAGFAPPTVPGTFALGGFELKTGQAVHFDITTTWHGVTGLPVPMESLQDDLSPKAVIVQVAGFAREEVGAAIAHAAHWIALDVAVSSK